MGLCECRVLVGMNLTSKYSMHKMLNTYTLRNQYLAFILVIATCWGCNENGVRNVYKKPERQTNVLILYPDSTVLYEDIIIYKQHYAHSLSRVREIRFVDQNGIPHYFHGEYTVKREVIK